MIEYYPWSKKVLNNILTDVHHNKFSILDLELGGECNCNCIYCDSPDRVEKIIYSFEMIRDFMISASFKWLFICGLGEPTFNKNYDILIELLKLCEQEKIKCSIFTNGTNVTKELKYFVRKKVLYILFKYDSLFDNVSTEIVGNNLISSYNDIFMDMTKLVEVENGCSNIAASIVPTVFNEKILVELVKKCSIHNIFPLIGSLENAGRAKNVYNNLSIAEEKLKRLKERIESELNITYRLPICPSTVGSIHITNKGDIVLDLKSGLSCSWFWMKDPNVVVLGNIANCNDYDDICKKIIQYRSNVTIESDGMFSNAIFGGCGGDISELLHIAKNS